MKANRKIVLAALTMPFLIPTVTSSAATPVDTCPSFAEYTSSAVKYIGQLDGSDLFLNQDGNRVAPCQKGNTTKFYLLSGFKNGPRIFAYSDSPIWNRQPGLHISDHNRYSYGDGLNSVSDTHDFQKQFLTKQIIDRNMPNPTEVGISINPSPSWVDSSNLPEKYKTQSAENKLALIKTHFLNINNRYANVQIDEQEFKKEAISANRKIKPTDNVINQYTLDKTFRGNTDLQTRFVATYGDIDGALFLTYKNATMEQAFLRSVPAFVLSIVTDDTYTLDQRLALAYKFDADQKFVKNLAKEYKDMTFEGYSMGASNEADLADIAVSVYKEMPEANRLEYNKLLVEINNSIYANEYDPLKTAISPDEYRKLSYVDKAKYAKGMDEKGKTNYQKRNPVKTITSKKAIYTDENGNPVYTQEVPATILQSVE